MEQIELALLYENAQDFVELINSSPSYFLDDENLDSLHTLMFMWDSGKCATAVLDGQTIITKLPLAISWLSQIDNGPMLFAAASNASKIAALLLQRGFSADVRGDIYGRRLKNMLPLPSHFGPLAVRGPLKTVRLFALNTRELKREFYNYLKEGKLIEVAVLLLVAKSQILSPSTSTLNKEFREFRSISEMHDFVLNAKCLRRNNDKLVEVEEILLLLRIIDKIGNKLETLLQHEFTPVYMGDCSMLLAESLIEEAGFKTKNVYNNHPFPRSEVVSYFSKRATDDCQKMIQTSVFGFLCRFTICTLELSLIPEEVAGKCDVHWFSFLSAQPDLSVFVVEDEAWFSGVLLQLTVC
ncbi:hypothetical protein KSS87_014954 [Heliosperma pusillum]|nr:hypothetical protein KSS87_014954 [Heliosperma pusillum]